MPPHSVTLLRLFAVVLLLSACASPTPTTAPIVSVASTSVPTNSSTAPARTPRGPAPQTPAPPQGQPPTQFFPTSAYQPTTSDLNYILGRPTTNSITLSLYAKAATQVSVVYGTTSKQYTLKTTAINLPAFAPQNIELTKLAPNTTYYYQVIANGNPSAEHTFVTQRPAGSSFVFTIDADPHNRDPRFNGQLYAIALNNARNDHPDFHINLGDTFMTEKVQAKTYEEAASTFTDMRPYFGLLNADAPLFLVNGNHEGELGWLLPRGSDKNLPIWSTQLRQLYYPNPTPNNFYSGGSTPDAYLGGVRDGYYAWTWGDALFVVLDPFWYTTDKSRPDNTDTYWNWTLGKEQYDWLKATLKNSNAKFKFVFIHNLVGGTELDGAARGGVEFANLYEWGGYNPDGSYGFDKKRPGWGEPIHKMLVANHVTAVFHGHDHVFVKQELDGIVYQETPQPSNADYNNTRIAAEYGYKQGVILGSSGHLRLTVTPAQVKVEYVRAYLPKDEKANQKNGQVDYTYTLNPARP